MSEPSVAPVLPRSQPALRAVRLSCASLTLPVKNWLYHRALLTAVRGHLRAGSLRAVTPHHLYASLAFRGETHPHHRTLPRNVTFKPTAVFCPTINSTNRQDHQEGRDRAAVQGPLRARGLRRVTPHHLYAETHPIIVLFLAPQHINSPLCIHPTGKITKKGVIAPLSKDLYEPLLEVLEKEENVVVVDEIH